MNLVTLFNQRQIVGISEGTLRLILEDRFPEIHVKKSGNGLIMLSNNKIIKCVQEYYTVPGKKKIQHSGISKCYKVQQEIGVLEEVSLNDCTRCHLACMRKKRQGELVRI